MVALIASLRAASAPPQTAPRSSSVSLLAALGHGVAVGKASGAATAESSRGRSRPQPRPAVGGGTGALVETLDLAAILRDDTSPYALRPADPEAFDALVTAFADAVASSGADSINRQDARYFDGYWSRFCAEQNTSRLCSDVATDTDTGSQGYQREVPIQALFIVYVYENTKPKRRGAPAQATDRGERSRRRPALARQARVSHGAAGAR